MNLVRCPCCSGKGVVEAVGFTAVFDTCWHCYGAGLVYEFVGISTIYIPEEELSQ